VHTRVAIIIGLVWVAGLIGLDICLAVDGRAGNTWSEIIRTWARETPVVPWICGVLTGHFFHPDIWSTPILGEASSIAFLIWGTVVVGMLGLICSRLGYPVAPWTPLVPAFVAGALLWPVEA